MRSYLVCAVLAALVLVAVISIIGPTVVQAKNWGFTNADFNGTYGSQWTGSVFFPTPPFSSLNGPYSLLGRVAADGRGNLSAKWIECYNGTIIPATGSGTYTVKSDGTLIMNVSYELPSVGTLSLEMTGVLFDDGRQARLMASKIIQPEVPAGFTGMTATTTLVRQGRSWGWTDGDWTGSYAARASGTIALPAQHPLAILNGPFAAIGRITVDGRGNYAGTVLTSLNGFVSEEPATGAYEVGPDGWIKLTVQGATLTLIYDGVLLDGGNQAYLLLTEVPGAGLPAGFTGITWVEIDARQ